MGTLLKIVLLKLLEVLEWPEVVSECIRVLACVIAE